MSYRKKKSLSGKINCLNFRPVNDLIGEWALTPAPTFLVGRNSSGSQLWLWWAPHNPVSCLPGLIRSRGCYQRLSGSGLLMIGDRFRGTN